MRLRGEKSKSCGMTNNKIHPGGEELLLAYGTRWSRTESSGGDMFCCCFFLLTLCKDVLFSSVRQSLPQGTRILNAQLRCGVAGWMDPLQTCDSGRCWFQDQDHLECNENKSAIASNQCIQLFLKKHYENFFEPVCKPLERILSKYVQLDQASFVLKREFIRKYSENNKHH